MAIVPMEKILIVAHRSQAGDLLEALQDAGLVQLLPADQAMVSKEWPELQVDFRRPKELEELVGRLEKAIAFLESHAKGPAPTSLFAPQIEIDASTYSSILSGRQAMNLLEETEAVHKQLDRLETELEQTEEQLERLLPWRNLLCRLEELTSFRTVQALIGLIASQNVPAVEAALAELTELPATIEIIGESEGRKACVIFCLAETSGEVQKILRNAEFEPARLEGLKGTPAELIEQCRRRQEELKKEIGRLKEKAAELAERRLELKVLFDYYSNLLKRKTAQLQSPATEQTLFLEGWVKRKDYPRLEEIVHRFDGCDVTILIPCEGEEPPVEIENPPVVRPFETITRLYGMPAPTSVDPTVFLAPFFAIFFGLCLADAGYGLILMVVLGWILKKMRGPKAAFQMLFLCGFTTLAAGIITGGWFGDAITSLLGPDTFLERLRVRLMLFDPMSQPMVFFVLSLILGYVQIQVGLFIALIHNLRKRDFAAAIVDQGCWIVMLNCLACLGLAKGGILPATLAKPMGLAALVPAAGIFLFSGRGLGMGGRVGIGLFQLFSTVFYLSDILSYARLMALGMVGSGFGLAINVLVKLVMDVPWVGWLLGALVFVVGHLFNLGMSMLGAFVHSLRLQFVEFFPKFLTGGGQEFRPLRKEFKHIAVRS